MGQVGKQKSLIVLKNLPIFNPPSLVLKFDHAPPEAGWQAKEVIDLCAVLVAPPVWGKRLERGQRQRRVTLWKDHQSIGPFLLQWQGQRGDIGMCIDRICIELIVSTLHV